MVGMQRKRESITLTENQRKVIKDKYLKDSPTVEAWLDLVVSNIALADVLHHKSVSEKEIFNGINYKIVEKEGAAEPVKMQLLHYKLDSLEGRSKNFKKYLVNLQSLAEHHKEASLQFEKTREEFYTMLSSFQFLPNSPTLMNAGRALQQLSACYVLPIEDSIEGWMKTISDTAIIHKSGGGTGFSASRIRPQGEAVSSTKGIASGPLSPLKMIDEVTNQIKQGGTRRGANMGILSVYHPNILEFINCKKQKGFLENFNISVAIDEQFMQKVKNDEEYWTINPKTKESHTKLRAKDVFDLMVKGAWETGDPGYVVMDRINNSDSNPTPNIGQIESTNPCGEQPLLPYEPCNLGSINLSRFVNASNTDMDWEALHTCVHTAIHFLDNVIDVNNYPLPEIEEMAKGNRRIGLGVMGWAETLALLKIPYNGNDAVGKGEQVMKYINDAALEASENLAVERGIFPNWKGSIFDPKSVYFRGKECAPRHCARTTIAPTGTIGITAGLQGAGIEPFFAIAYVRYNAQGIDALKKGEKPAERDTFFEVNPIFKEVAEQHHFFGMKEEELWQKIEKNHKAVKGVKEIPESIQNAFLTAHDLSPLDHVRMQVAFQKHTNNAVSKTVNLRNEATVEDVKEVYMLGYEYGVKGITIYRDGSKDLQVLNLSEKKKLEEPKVRVVERKKGPAVGELSSYYEIQTGQGSLHIHINYDEEGPKRVFANISPTGTEISGMTTALGILISKYLELGGDPRRLVKHLNSIKGDRPYGVGPKRVDSVPHGLAKAIRDHLLKTNKLNQIDGQAILETGQQMLLATQVKKTEAETVIKLQSIYCPKCFSANVEVVGGCSGPTCFDCGHSECS
ncbi:adenosylcobalamin-dependent ribonucleoside-diphosphate reductase [Candidatus Woesearchaeota archaeon]|nr:adenosylcobalamin-dependent ribonucleoside-diphosphate reductase [Candidatus Woesearchaeota archaeon]